MLTRILDSHTPPDWCTTSTSTANYKAIEIPPSHASYAAIRNKVTGSFNAGIAKVVRVENPFMYGHFLLKKAEYETRGATDVVELFHDTGAAKVDSILRTNLDWRRANRVKFGRGVSFSPSPGYANKESARSNGTDRAMIIADVLVGKKYVTNRSDSIPRVNCDTAVGNSGNVYVKFDDNEFYPKYVVYYTSKRRGLGRSLQTFYYDSLVEDSLSHYFDEVLDDFNDVYDYYF